MGAGSLSDILQCLWKAKIRLKKAGNDWTDLLVVNVMASLVYDLEGFQPPAFWMRGWRADSLLYLTPCNFPTTCRVPAGEKGAQGPPPCPEAITPRCTLCRWGQSCDTKRGGQLVFFFWQGHEAGQRASAMPPNEFSPPVSCRMKIIPYSHTINTNITLSLKFFLPLQSVKSKSKWEVLEEIFTPWLQSRNLLWLKKNNKTYNFRESFAWLNF